MSRYTANQMIDEPRGETIAPDTTPGDEHFTPPMPGVAPNPPAQETAAMEPAETHKAHTSRMLRRTRLHLCAIAAVLVLIYVVALATSNTVKVRVDWVFAHSSVPLVWLTLFAVILGWVLGTLVTILFRRRTRAAGGEPA